MTNILDFNLARRQGELPRTDVDVHDIRSRLHSNPRSFIEWLFSGRAYIFKNGQQARIGDVQGNPGNSLSITLKGDSAGLWIDHATGEGGDLIELYRAYMGYGKTQDFILSLKEISKEFFHDPIQIEKSEWQPTALERIDKKKATLGTKPRADMLQLGAPVALYPYFDTRGNIISSVVRFEPDGTRENKTFRPYCHKTVEGVRKWLMGAPDLRPLYRLPEISLTSTVVLCEGEGCAVALASLGIEATTAMQGAYAPIEKTDWAPLHGKTVIVWPDKDEPGLAYGRAVAARLVAIGCIVKVITPPPDKPDRWDAADCVAAGEDPRALIDEALPFYDFARPKPEIDPSTGDPIRLVLTAAQFVAGFTPPEYLIDGIMQRGYLYSLTARTGHGKTAVSMYKSQCVARGVPFHGAAVKKGTVLLLAGENPDDIRARFLVLADATGFQAEDLKMRFVAGVVDIATSMPTIRAEADKIGDLVLVIVDTAAAYFRGDDSNSNSQQGEYARLLRGLTFLPGKPAVLVNCHPIKNASKDNLLPMGGSAFLNEVDGNLTLWANAENQTTLHWQGKFRGPEFEPLTFELKTAECERVVNSDGVLMPSVVAVPVSDTHLAYAEDAQDRDEIALLGTIARYQKASIAEIALKCRFLDVNGKPLKSKVFRIAQRLCEDKLLERVRRKLRITAKGKKEIGWNDNDE